MSNNEEKLQLIDTGNETDNDYVAPGEQPFNQKNLKPGDIVYCYPWDGKMGGFFKLTRRDNWKRDRWYNSTNREMWIGRRVADKYGHPLKKPSAEMFCDPYMYAQAWIDQEIEAIEQKRNTLARTSDFLFECQNKQEVKTTKKRASAARKQK
jgi:hypothetical protein